MEDMKIEPRVSVIMPSYNIAGYIRESIESVIDQSLKEIEIICVDAGSTDGTAEIIQEYARNDKRIRFITSEKKSYGYQMNLGIKKANAKYIGIVETDDYIGPDMYRTLFEKAESFDAEVVKATQYDVYDYGEKGRVIIPTRYLWEEDFIDRPFSTSENPGVFVWDSNIWTGIYKKAFLEEHGIRFRETPGAAFQDIGFQQLVLNSAKRLVYELHHFYYYRKVRNGASTWTPRCVEFIYGEYRNLIENGLIKEEFLPSLYRKVSFAFLYEYQKALSYEDYILDKIPCKEGVLWFRDTFSDGLKKGIISKEKMNSFDYDRVIRLVDSAEDYATWWKKQDQPAVMWQKQLRQRIGSRRLLIFGCGRYGRKQMIIQIRNGIIPCALVDNSLDLWIQSIYGIPIISPEDASLQFPNDFYLIAAKSGAADMKNQLMRLGISQEQIELFDGSDEELKEFFLSEPFLLT